MTVVAVHKNPQGIHLISDSRLTIGSSKIDVGVKVCAIDYRIFGARNPDGTQPELATGRFGFCFAGSSLTAYAVKESIAEIVYNIQTTIDKRLLSFRHLSEIVFDAYVALSTEIASYLSKNSFATIVICGKLPADNEPRAFWLKLRDDGSVDSSEVDFQQSNSTIFGSGEKFIDKDKREGLGALAHEINRICNDGSVDDVGPPIQFGRCDSQGNFKCFGQIIIDDNGVQHARAGIDLNNLNSIRSGTFNPLFEYIELSD
ncbi:hypothetical protein AB6B38_07265 [Glycocaulis abyssi]|uniref:Uncharacterized protein n=1 Tax=Glycocaulis abyssi TaxID=1433403 RepID=A0ABV9NCM8_9PROT